MATVAIARIAERDLDELISSRQLIAAYAYEEALGRVTVLAFHDARSAGVAIEER